MDSLENILNSWEKDGEIDRIEPGRELLNIPKLNKKYLKYLTEATMLLKKTENDIARNRKIKYEYYNGNYNTDKEFLKEKGWEPFKLILKNDIGTYLAADDDLIKLTDKKVYYEQIIKTCELIIKELNNRVWELKSFIDYEKFINGA